MSTGDGGDGWRVYDIIDPQAFPGRLASVEYRPSIDRRYDLRFVTASGHGNQFGAVHGAFLVAMAEHCAGIVAHVPGLPTPMVTISMACDYPAGMRIGAAVTGAVEVTRETGRMLFVRGHFLAAGETVLGFMVTLRKISVP